MRQKPMGRDSDQILAEDEVSSAVRSHLEKEGWTITSWAPAIGRVRGDDIAAELKGRKLVVEVKGEGSSNSGSRKPALVSLGITIFLVNRHGAVTVV